MEKSTVIIEPADGVGAYIRDINLNDGLSQPQVDELRNALGDYGVLFFTDQELTPEKPCIFWEIEIQTDADEAEINSVFEFVEGLCTLEIEKAGSAPAPAMELPADLPPPPPTLPDDD